MNEINKYIGVKIISAEPALASEDDKRGKYPVGYEGYKVTYEDGYQSWSPKDVFDDAYRRIDRLTFGLAIEAMKLGKKVARAGWNGKGMWLLLVPGGRWGVDYRVISDESHDGFLPWIGMKTADNKFVPWLASQTDVLAEDYFILD